MKRQLVIGAGTGRCGTTTLAKLLDLQPGGVVTHERMASKFKWNQPAEAMQRIMHTFNNMDAGLIGDVALQHGCCLPQWCDKGAKVVILKRDLDGYLASWKKKAANRNNWQPAGQGGTKKSRWFHCFPKFNGCANRQEALIMYYNHYYTELAPAVMDQYPDQVLLCYVDIFNSDRGQRRLLDFLGVPRDEQIIRVGLKKNRLAS